MGSKDKYIGINQRLPFEVLDSAIDLFLKQGKIDKEAISMQMSEYISGKNRLAKSVTYVENIIKRQSSFLNVFKKSNPDLVYLNLRLDDRKAMVICLICLTYPIAYDLLVSMSQSFKVQAHINRKSINHKIMSIYGSNETVSVAVKNLLPIFLEAKLLKREKIGIYAQDIKLIIKNAYVAELIIYSDIKLSASKSMLIDELSHKPWYAYFVLPIDLISTLHILLTKKDSTVGKGYLTIHG